MSDFLHRLPEFMGNHLLLSLGFIGVVLALAYMEAQRFTRGYASLTPAGATQLINRDNPLLVDMSARADYESGHISGARHVSPDQFDPESKELAKVKSRPVLVYCGNGQRSGQAAKRLVKAGFEKVNWLDGGLRMWKEAHLPLVRGSGRS